MTRRTPTSRFAVTLLLATLSLAGIGLGACGDDDNPAEVQSGSGTLTIYSGREEEIVGPLFERYEKESATKLQVRYGESPELSATILEEADNSPADVFFSQDAGALGVLEKADRLATLAPAITKQVDARFRSQAGRWVGTSGRARIVAYNKEKLRQSALPKSILDFTDRRWKGKIGWAPTNASFQSFVTALRKLKGDAAALAWLKGIVANEPQTYEKNSAVRDAIASGEIELGFINHYYVAQARAEEGDDYPVAIYNPPGGDPGSLINVAGVGILAGSSNTAAAEAFVRFLLSAKAQRFFAETTKEYPLAAGVEAERDLVPLDRIEAPDIDLSDLDDLQRTVELIEQSGAL